jgi:hypothetical protein
MSSTDAGQSLNTTLQAMGMVSPGAANLAMNPSMRLITTPGSPIFVGKQTNNLIPLLLIGGVAAAIYFF